jgi:hypothetical protein
VSRVLYVLACGAGPAADVGSLAALAQSDGWDVYVGATPAGWSFLDVDGISALTGHPPRHHYSGRTSGWPPADGIVVAAATLNTVGKFAAGIADNWALSVMTEAFGQRVPLVIAPNVNPALARHPVPPERRRPPRLGRDRPLGTGSGAADLDGPVVCHARGPELGRSAGSGKFPESL